MNGTEWVSAHIFCHGNLDTLLVDLVTPLTTELVDQGLARRFFFLRYWDGGPHVRLRVLPADGSGDEVRDHVARRCGDYLTRNPAPDRITQEEYERTAAVLAQRETMTPNPRMYPNNSVEFIPYVPEVHRFGEGASIEAVELHFAEASRIALELLALPPSPEQRDTAAFAVILLTWLLCDPDPAGLSEPSELEDQYRRQREKLLAIADQMRSIISVLPRLPRTGSTARWAWSVIRTRDVVADPAMPVLDQCAHLMCNRLGVQTGGESVLRYLAGRTMSDLAGER